MRGSASVRIPPLDAAVLATFPVGYQHLGYMQQGAGLTVTKGLPGLVGEAVDALYAKGHAWLSG